MKRWIKYTAILMLLVFPAFCFAGSTRNAKMSGGKLTNLLANSGSEMWSNGTLCEVTSNAAPVTTGANAALVNNLLSNGGFDSDTVGWTESQCTLASVAGGETGNCIQITRVADTVQSCQQSYASAVVGKLYQWSVWIKTGTSGNEPYIIDIGSIDGGNELKRTTGTSSGTWVQVSGVVEATTTTVCVRAYKNSATAGTMLFDSVTLHEAAPGCVGADILASDGHSKTATLDALREWNAAGANTYGKGMFLGKKIKGADSAEYYNYDKLTGISYLDLLGQPVAVGCWIYSLTAADNAKLSIHDGISEIALSTSYVPANVLTWVEVTGTVAANATKVQPRILLDGDTADVAYVSHIILVQGSSIGEGNYSAPPGEIIYCEKDIIPTGYDFSAFSDTDAVMNLEALTSGKVPKGVKAVKVAMKLADAAPADTIGVWLGPDTTYTAQDIGDVGAWLHASIAGDDPIGANGWVRCGTTGDIWNYIQASGAGTLDLEIRISAIEMP